MKYITTQYVWHVALATLLKKGKKKLADTSLMKLIFSVMFLSVCGGVSAAGGIGSVWSTGSDEDSISITWTVPGGDYNHVGSNYKVCYRTTPTANVCGGVTAFSTPNSFTASSLNSATEYKFKVWCFCEKRNWLGNWKDAKWRKIGTYKQSTSPEPVVDVLVSNISVVDVSPGVAQFDASIDVQVTYTNPAAFEFIRTCYKKLGNMTSMNSICSDRDQPPTSWVTSDHGRGWLDVEPAPSGTIFSFGNLKQCKQYKVVSYAFYEDIDTGLKLGETNVHTPGDCKANKMAVVIVNDYSDTLLKEYIELVSPYYEQHLFHYLTAQYGPELVTAHKQMMEEERVDIVQPKALIEYLIGSESRIWDGWQQERLLVEQRLTLDGFVADKYPELYKDILDDLLEPSRREKVR
jgi:hypothetical protein